MYIVLTSLADKLKEVFDELIRYDEVATDLIKVGSKLWNGLISVAYQLLGLSVEDFSGGSGYELIERVSPTFAAVGTLLMILFYLYGLFEESFEDKQFDVWAMVKSIGLLCLGEYLLTNCNKLLCIVLKTCGGLISYFGSRDLLGLKITPDQYISDFEEVALGPGKGLVALLFALVTVLVMMLCAGVIVYVVYFRYIKILMCLPFAPLAISTITGNREVKRTSYAYLRYFCSLALESIVIMLALMLCNAILGGGMPELVKAIEGIGWHVGDLMTLILDCFMLMFTCCLTVGSVKGAEQLALRMIGS